MVGNSLLNEKDFKLKQIKSQKSDELFGGLIVLLLDFRQLSPINDFSLFTNKTGSLSQNKGKMIYNSIKKVFILNKSFRQMGLDQKTFRNLLENIGTGKITIEDWKLMLTRRKQVLDKKEQLDFKNAIRFYSKLTEVKDYNLKKLKKLMKPIVKIQAKDTKKNIIDLEKKTTLDTNLYLCKGARIILIKFDNYLGPSYKNLVPIIPIKKIVKINNEFIERMQFPVQLAWAITIHKAQGLTLEKAVINFGSKEFQLGLTYVAMSRVKKLESIMFDNYFNYDRLQKINNNIQIKYRLEEKQRLKNLASQN